MRRSCTALLVALLLTGCATAPQPPAADPHRFTELVPGTSTKEEAIAKLGAPNSVSDMRGQTLVQWIDVTSGSPIHVAIIFGADGRMVKVQHVFSQ